MKIFKKKKIQNEHSHMLRHLNVIDLVLLGMGAMVGTGIFTVTGIGAANFAGPALIISIIISAVSVGLSALFFAEFASKIPTSGGAYGYIYATLGEFPAWIVGWLIIMEFLTAVSSVASGWGSYLKGLLVSSGISIPNAINGTLNISKGNYIDLLPVLVMFVVSGIVFINSHKALKFNNFLVLFKFSALFLFIVIGLFYVDFSNFKNFSPYGFGQIYGGKQGIMAGASLMFFAFLGFESISMAVDEVIEPQKTIPRGIGVALTTVTVLYIIVTFVLTGMVNYTKLNVPDAVAFALRSVGMTWAANYVSIVAILTLITVCISMTYALARTIYSISKDGLLPKKFSKISGKQNLPQNATIIASLSAIICTGIFPLASLAEFLNICTLAYLIILAIALIKLKGMETISSEQEFNTPFGIVLPIISVIICISLMSQYKVETWLSFIISLIIAIFIYFIYGKNHSEIK